jgi:hypothetical protein
VKHWLAIVALCGTAATAAEVQAPHWGDALFHVYQGQNFTAVTTLMASQQLQRLGPHGDEAEATRGGLLLAYGLHREAEAIFAGLAERGTTPALRDRAWFFLAKIRWQRGLPAPADAALAQVKAPLPEELEEERQLLAARLRLALGDAAGAARLLQGLADQAEGTPYARFNLGVALLQGQDAEAGRRWLDGLGTMKVETAPPEERRALRDKANLALGFDALKAGRPEQARATLERVRLKGPYAQQALLGFGWAAAALKQPREALVPWQELLSRDASDPAVLEARLAVPWALAELKADGAAIDGYQQAVAAFDAEHRALEQTITSLQTGQLVEALLERNPGADLGWLWQVKDLPALPHPAHLTPLMATHGFQEALKDQRDLRFLQGNLGRWANDLQVFDTMLATRRARFAAHLPAAQQQTHRQRQQRLVAEQAALTQALAQTDNDGPALADERERALLERLARVRSVLATAPADEAGEALRERARRVAGALEWQLSQALPERLWAAKKALRSTEADLASAAARDAALQAAQRDEPSRFDSFAQRIAALRARVATLTPQVAALRQEQQASVQALAVQALREQQARLGEYTTQARFALAQLQDRATVAQQDTPDAAR